MPTTPRGIQYPASTEHTRLWEHYQNLAETADSALDDVQSGSAGGDLTGTYPNPTIASGAVTSAKIADGTIVHGDVASANIDGVAATPSLRTLGTGSQQAAAGNHNHDASYIGAGQSAGGDLTGTYPNPTIATGAVTSAKIADGTIVHGDIASANIDGTAGTASMRTLGTGSQQAAAGNHNHDATYAPISVVPQGQVPIGGIIMFSGSDGSHPFTGDWLNCNGQAISRTTYADYFTLVGTTYGAGDGSTTFNIPNLTDRFPVGESGTKALGSTGGSETHSHDLGDNAWAQVAMFAANIVARRISVATGWVESFRSSHTDIAESGTAHTVATPLDGATDSASSLPPYLAINYIVRVK